MSRNTADAECFILKGGNAMRATTITAQMLVRITGLIQLVLGILFWTGSAIALVPVHIISGLVLVISLWVLAFMAISTKTNPRLGWLSLAWGLVVAALGMAQGGLLPGSAHWVVDVIHLLLGIGAIGMAENLGRSLLQNLKTLRVS
jgi:hypothetical protein